MKKYLKVFVFVALFVTQTMPVFAETTQSSSNASSNLTSSMSASSQVSSAQSSSQSAQSSGKNTAPSSSDTQKTTTTTQQEAKTPAVSDNQNPSQKGTNSSTTIIKETVTNNNKGNNSNIWTIVLTSLSALVTISGGLIAVLRHFRNLRKKNEFDQSVKLGKPSESSKAMSETGQKEAQANQKSKTAKESPRFRRSKR